MELLCSIQTYNWGKKGSTSAVANLAKLNHISEISDDTPYAELWMGDHPSGPSRMKNSSQLLSEYIFQNPLHLGLPCKKAFGCQLPYLFKVLSVEKPLSVQAHPTKSHAETLHMQYPSIYKDGNHKPEIAIALTNFEALCGFRPVSEIENLILGFPELREFIGANNVTQLQNGNIKPSFSALMACDSKLVTQLINNFLLRKDGSVEQRLIARLNDHFPGDVGVLCTFWLNYVTLCPGESLFLAPNEPHAYIFGDCVECMANSDNVVRAGLTPKFRDVTTLCEMLSYKTYTPSQIKFSPIEEDKNTTLYRPPVPDFAVARIKVSTGGSYYMKPVDSASIILVVAGDSLMKSSYGLVEAKSGTVIFAPAGEEIEVQAKDDNLIFRAFCNL